MSEAEPNPLTGPIFDALRRHPLGLSEYQLLQEIAEFLPAVADDATLALFQKHFLVMNALYRLQQSLWQEERLHLAISPLLIRIESAMDREVGLESSVVPALATDQPLRDYYLDWERFLETDRQAVDELLGSFWRRFHAADAVAAALQTLGLPADSDWDVVRQRYRKLAAASHPDRGGSPRSFWRCGLLMRSSRGA